MHCAGPRPCLAERQLQHHGVDPDLSRRVRPRGRSGTPDRGDVPDALRAHFAWRHADLARDRPFAVAAFENALAVERDVICLGSLGHAYGRAGGDDALEPLGLLVLDVRLTTFEARFTAGENSSGHVEHRGGHAVAAATDTLQIGTPRELQHDRDFATGRHRP